MTNRPNNDELGDHYRVAMEEWYASEDAALWDSITGDGIEDEPPWPEPPANANESGGAERRR